MGQVSQLFSKLTVSLDYFRRLPIVRRYFFATGFVSAIWSFEHFASLIAHRSNFGKLFPHLVAESPQSLAIRSIGMLAASAVLFALSDVRSISLKLLVVFATICCLTLGLREFDFQLTLALYFSIWAFAFFGDIRWATAGQE
jgi:hypothetical protein